MKRIILLMITALLTLSGTEKALADERTAPLVIVLDPGHDTTHSGDGGNGLREEALNLKIAQYCLEELRTYNNVEVHMTRYTESCPYSGKNTAKDNLARVEFAESVQADVYISLHLNSAAAAAKGVEIFYPNANYRPALSTVGKELSTSILNELTGLGLHKRGVFIRDAETSRYEDGSLGDYYQVIREAKIRNIPAIIVEHAFISNASDAANFLSTEAKLKALGVADATGIAKYYGLRKGGYEKVFDPVFYADKYEDVKQLYGYDEDKLLDHFIEIGMREGRQGIGDFDPYAYRGRYEDLATQYKDQMQQYYIHYMEQGKTEGRSGAPVDEAYTVTFMHEEEVISTQSVRFGHGATNPDAAKEGMYTVYDREFYCITEDTVVFISYEPIVNPTPTPDTEEDTVTEPTETETEDSKATESEESELEDTDLKDTEIKDTEIGDTEIEDTEIEGTESEDTESQDTELADTQTEGVHTQETEGKDAETEDTQVWGGNSAEDNKQDSSWTMIILIVCALACIGVILVLLVQLIKNKKDMDS